MCIRRKTKTFCCLYPCFTLQLNQITRTLNIRTSLILLFICQRHSQSSNTYIDRALQWFLRKNVKLIILRLFLELTRASHFGRVRAPVVRGSSSAVNIVRSGLSVPILTWRRERIARSVTWLVRIDHHVFIEIRRSGTVWLWREQTQYLSIEYKCHTIRDPLYLRILNFNDWNQLICSVLLN